MKKTDTLQKIKDTLTNKETISVFFIILFLAASLSSLFVSPQLYQGRVHEGDIALKDMYAPYDFTYLWEVNEEGTQEAKESAARAVPHSLRRDLAVEKKVKSDLDDLFVVLEAENGKDYSLNEKITSLREKTGTQLSDKDLRMLLESTGKRKFREKTGDIVENVFLLGYADETDLQYLKGTTASKVIILNEKTGKEIERRYEDILGKSASKKVIEEYSASAFGSDRKVKQAAAVLAAEYIKPNLKLDEKLTNAKKEEARKKVSPVYHSWGVKKNELIVEKGKRINARHIAQLSQLRSIFKPGKTPTFFMGILLLFILLGLVAAIYMKFTQKANFLQNTRDMAIVLLNMFLLIVLSDFIVRSPQPSYFIPMASMAMMITLLSGFSVAFLSVVIMNILISVLVGGKIELAVVLLVGSMVGMFMVRGARRRGNILWAGLLVGLSKFAAIVCIGLINGMEANFYLSDGAWGIASGLVSGFIVLGLLPVFEHLFNVPTNVSLLELSDLNHPLLKKMAMEAPGTYHHSIMVGNLAEAACDAIGANSLMARVGAYYHDIGKTPKADYFSENEMGAGSKHGKLSPSMSALIIAKHVKEGVEIAKKYKLNKTIVDYITQHHGNSLIIYFYQKALEKSGAVEVLKEENFRYPGPKPQTKESAIVLLADSVEASSRTLSEPTPSSIRNLVKKIINNKFIDGQLDECDLTLKDMHMIAGSFVRVLMGFFHTRLEYPETEEVARKKEEIKKTESTSTNGSKGKLRKPKRKKKD